jgi:hypothetical protein
MRNPAHRPVATTAKRIALAASVAAALASPSLALAGGSLAGTYKTTIASPAQFKGTFILKLAAGGAYTVTDDGHLIVRGKYAGSGSKITFGHETGQGACAKTGTYTWTKSGKTLRFKRVSDAASCNGRITILSHALTQSH